MLTITTTCDFERGGATKPMSWTIASYPDSNSVLLCARARVSTTWHHIFCSRA